MKHRLTRRTLLLAAAAGSALLVACATPPGGADLPPIVFVPGNGDTAALWMPTIWRFESNGWPRDRLHAIDMPYPLARDDDAKAQPGRSSSAEHMAYLAAEVKKVLAATGAKKVVLVGNSRGGYAIRNFVANGGAALVSHVVLGGVPNHGVWANPGVHPGSEFNGAGPFLTRLNTPQGEWQRGDAGRRVADDPLRQQRQVRAARRRLDRRARNADQRDLRRPGAEGRGERRASPASTTARRRSARRRSPRRTASSPGGRRRRWRSFPNRASSSTAR